MEVYSTVSARANRLAAKSSNTDINATVVETSVFSTTVPGGTLGTDAALMLSMVGSFENDTTATRTATIRVKFGGTVVFLGDVVISSAYTSRSPIALDVWLYAQGATNAQTGRMTVTLGLNSGSVDGGDIVQGSVLTGFVRSVAVDSTANQVFEVTIQHSNADFFTRIDSAQLVRFGS